MSEAVRKVVLRHHFLRPSTPPRPHSPRVPRGFVGRVVAEPLPSILELFSLDRSKEVFLDILIIAKHVSFRLRQCMRFKL